MPKLRQPPAKQELPEIQDHAPPVEDIEIELSGDEPGDAEIDLSAQPSSPIELVPSPDPAPKPSGDDDAMVRAAEATRRADELQRTNTELQRQARERDEELARERGDKEQAQYDTLLGHISAQQEKLESARRAIRAAKSSGDMDAEIDAVEQMTDAKSQLSQLESGKAAFDLRKVETRDPPEPRSSPPPTVQDFEAKISPLPDTAKTWLRKHPEFMNDPTLNKKIGAAHNYLTDVKGVEAFSAAYFDALDDQFGFKVAPAADPAPQPQPQRRSIPMSAPVSRDVPTPSGLRQPSSKMTLTAEERQIARSAFTAADMTNEQKELAYARNKQKLQKMRASGEYPNSERS